MTPKGGHVQPAHAEPRIGRSHEFHHFAGGLPAATFVGERTFRWRGVGSDTRDYFHAPLPRRERVAAFLTRRPFALECERAGFQQPAVYHPRARLQAQETAWVSAHAVSI